MRIRIPFVLGLIIPIVLFLMPYPVIVALGLIFDWGTYETMLIILTLTMVYITIIQVDVALRNTALQEAEFQPILIITVQKGSGLPRVFLKNVGKYLAYSVAIGILPRPPNVDIEPFRREAYREVLRPNEDMEILQYDPRLGPFDLVVRISYRDITNQDREALFVKLSNFDRFIPLDLPINVKGRGILFPVFEKIDVIRAYWKFRKLIKSQQRQKG